MTYDVSVLIPAYRAEDHIARAAASVLRQEGVTPQIVIAADDGADYLAHLQAQGIDCAPIVQCRTPKPASGCGPARNCAAARAEAPILATLDADDEYCEGRLDRLVRVAQEHGAATGETIELARDGSRRVARPAERGDGRLTLDTIARLRMPFCPVFRQELLGDGWPDLAFAEDMVFNAGLATRARRYTFVEDAGYLYHLRPDSLTEDAHALPRALGGYHQILAYLETVDWPARTRDLVREVIKEDIAMVEAARAKGGTSWRQAWADWRAGAANGSPTPERA